jgi:uncharacterized protein
MPLVEPSSYTRAPWYQPNQHFQTVLPSLFLRPKVLQTKTVLRMTTQDDDFIDIDFYENNSAQLVILTHGLEGNSERPYILSMAKMMLEAGHDVAAWNCRSCSGEMNRQFRMYDHGEIGDLGELLDFLTARKSYTSITLMGFSMGGNIVLKYTAQTPHPLVTKVLAFSAPLDMRSSVEVIEQPNNWLYKEHFIRNLLKKLLLKAQQFPERLDATVFKDLRKMDWRTRASYFFVTINGYVNLDDFFERGSALHYLHQICTPTLIVQAENDPMLTPLCLPREMLRSHPHIWLETPKVGGHVGFSNGWHRTDNWMDSRALAFIQQ